MAPPPSAPPPAAWEFFERKRRLAYYLAWASLGLLAVELLLGSALAFYGHARAVGGDGAIWVAHRCPSRDEPEGSQILFLDAELKPRREPLRLVDPMTAFLPEGPDLTVFYGSRGSFVARGSDSRPVDLGQTWEVLAAVPDPGRGQAWIFGQDGGKIQARRRVGGAWQPAVAVADAGRIDRMGASMDGPSGPLVAWRETGQTRVRTALFDGTRFAPAGDFDVGDAQHWDAVRAGGRTILAAYHRDDRTFESVTLRLECCAGCRAPIVPRKLALAEPLLLLGRRVTGLALVMSGDRLIFIVARPSTLLWAAVRASTLEADRMPPRLAPIPLTPPWLAVASAVTPVLLLFCSLSLIFLGFTLFRERTRILSGARSGSGDEPSEVWVRGMAYLLDLVVLWPVFVAMTEFLDVPLEDLNDPETVGLVMLLLGLEFVYHLLLEWRLGWTIGKGILGIRVAELDGGPVTFRGALVRNLLRVIDGQLPFSLVLGLGLMLRTQRRQRLGDLAAGTVVLWDTKRRPEPAARAPRPAA